MGKIEIHRLFVLSPEEAVSHVVGQRVFVGCTDRVVLPEGTRALTWLSKYTSPSAQTCQSAINKQISFRFSVCLLSG